MDNMREIPEEELRRHLDFDPNIQSFLSVFPVCKTHRGVGCERLGMYCPCVLAVPVSFSSHLTIYPLDLIDWKHCSGIWLPDIDREQMFLMRYPKYTMRLMQEGRLRREALPAVMEMML